MSSIKKLRTFQRNQIDINAAYSRLLKYLKFQLRHTGYSGNIYATKFAEIDGLCICYGKCNRLFMKFNCEQQGAIARALFFPNKISQKSFNRKFERHVGYKCIKLNQESPYKIKEEFVKLICNVLDDSCINNIIAFPDWPVNGKPPINIIDATKTIEQLEIEADLIV